MKAALCIFMYLQSNKNFACLSSEFWISAKNLNFKLPVIIFYVLKYIFL